MFDTRCPDVIVRLLLPLKLPVRYENRRYVRVRVSIFFDVGILVAYALAIVSLDVVFELEQIESSKKTPLYPKCMLRYI